MRTLLLAVPLAIAQPAAEDHVVLQPEDLVWTEGPDALPDGVQMAVLEGDPTAEGVFTLRLMFPADTRVEPHWHPADERVTVLSGAFHLGVGEVFDEGSTTPLTSGGFFYMPAEHPHFAWTSEETVIQITAEGPFGLTYVEPPP